jgi:phosphoribosylformylglycinamidine synthase
MKLIRNGLVRCAHDCSKGGLAVALAEMAVAGKAGFKVDIDKVPHVCKRPDEILFSESHSRYVIGTSNPAEVEQLLKSEGVKFAQVGRSARGRAEFTQGRKVRIVLPLAKLDHAFGAIGRIMQ